MREIDELRKRFDELDESGDPDQHRRDQHDEHAHAARELGTLAQQPRRPGQVRCVEHLAARLLNRLVDGALTRRDALEKRRVRLIGDSVIVLNDVDAAACEDRAQPREFADGDALRLERGARQRAVGGAEQCANARQPVRRSWKARHELVRQREVYQPDVLPERAVAENHVHELRRLAAGRLDRDLELDAVTIRRHGRDGTDARDDLVKHVLVADRGERALDALL